MNGPEDKGFSSREEEIASSDAIPDALPGENQAKAEFDLNKWTEETFGKKKDGSNKSSHVGGADHSKDVWEAGAPENRG